MAGKTTGSEGGGRLEMTVLSFAGATRTPERLEPCESFPHDSPSETVAPGSTPEDAPEDATSGDDLSAGIVGPAADGGKEPAGCGAGATMSGAVHFPVALSGAALEISGCAEMCVRSDSERESDFRGVDVYRESAMARLGTSGFAKKLCAPFLATT